MKRRMDLMRRKRRLAAEQLVEESHEPKAARKAPKRRKARK